MEVLRDKRVRRLFVAVGGEYAAEALLVVLLTLTALDSGPGGVTAVLVAQGIPRAVLLPFGGLISDRLGAAMVAPITAALRAVLLLGIAGAVIASPEVPILLLAVAGALLGVIDSISYPASMALVPAVAPKNSLAKVRQNTRRTPRARARSSRASRICEPMPCRRCEGATATVRTSARSSQSTCNAPHATTLPWSTPTTNSWTSS